MKKIVVSALLGILLIVFLIFWFYNSIESDQWQEQSAAVEQAYAQTALARTSKVEPFSGEQSYMIVFGQDEEGRDMIVWVGDEEVHAAYVSDGVSESQLRRDIASHYPAHRLLRLTPGKWHDQWVWEVFYSKREQTGERYYFDYFAFEDGQLLDTYRLYKR